MKTKDLIEALSKEDPEAIVFFTDQDFITEEIHGIAACGSAISCLDSLKQEYPDGTKFVFLL